MSPDHCKERFGWESTFTLGKSHRCIDHVVQSSKWSAQESTQEPQCRRRASVVRDLMDLSNVEYMNVLYVQPRWIGKIGLNNRKTKQRAGSSSDKRNDKEPRRLLLRLSLNAAVSSMPIERLLYHVLNCTATCSARLPQKLAHCLTLADAAGDGWAAHAEKRS